MNLSPFRVDGGALEGTRLDERVEALLLAMQRASMIDVFSADSCLGRHLVILDGLVFAMETPSKVYGAWPTFNDLVSSSNVVRIVVVIGSIATCC
ncbi:hypothetical protein GOP47_0008813 [Adiantum capillus-veneris]|uniref:Uncharacterized protein n=1 Tax=Adiantum capillus-veneris TaxID=13818 RepID=A0A9D4ZID7_ADICA|nr:hypothetical protein GOP47_0008813 [Adiantum capillus-veneris]